MIYLQSVLKTHLQLMLKRLGFIQAEILKLIDETTDDNDVLVVQLCKNFHRLS